MTYDSNNHIYYDVDRSTGAVTESVTNPIEYGEAYPGHTIYTDYTDIDIADGPTGSELNIILRDCIQNGTPILFVVSDTDQGTTLTLPATHAQFYSGTSVYIESVSPHYMDIFAGSLIDSRSVLVMNLGTNWSSLIYRKEARIVMDNAFIDSTTDEIWKQKVVDGQLTLYK